MGSGRVRVLLVAGPTAGGKSALAIALARAYGGEIINGDAMQVYRWPRILTAWPSGVERGGIVHHLYGFVSPGEVFSVARWRWRAVRVIGDVIRRGRLPIVVGGTGLYLEALVRGLAWLPPVSGAVRRGVRERMAVCGARVLHGELGRVDPVLAARVAPGDRQRVARGLEVFEATGRALSDWQRAQTPQEAGWAERFGRIVVMPSWEGYGVRCGVRVHGMVRAGAVEEARCVVAMGLAESLPVMRALGVVAFGLAARGEISIAEAVRVTVSDTVRYGRRQATWLRNRPLGCPGVVVGVGGEAGWSCVADFLSGVGVRAVGG